MSVKTSNTRIIFGLKVRQLRQEKQLSFSELSEACGLSVSYLNEIEKGKKYPKEERIQALAKALGISVAELTESDLKGGLAPVADLLKSNFLNELPLELFGIELGKVIEIIANAPKRVGAFISTLVELSRNYALGEENFYFGALRSFLEMHNNYFPEIEEQVEAFARRFSDIRKEASPVVDTLAGLLEKEYGYRIVEQGLDPYPELQDLRSVYVPQRKELLLNGKMTDIQRAFQFGKELGFQYLGLKERANTSSLLRVSNFEEVLSHFKAGYFSAALLIDRASFVPELEGCFQKSHWEETSFSQMLNHYQVSPEMLFQRMSNLLPHHFGLNKLFLLRVIHDPVSDRFRVDKELHLDRSHHPHANGIFEHYCRRWLSISMLQDLYQKQAQREKGKLLVQVQRSRYHGTEDEYLVFNIARPAYPTPDKNVSISIGLLIDAKVQRRIRFLDDPAIPRRIVNQTCERCPIQDCTERVAAPTYVQSKEKRNKVEARLKEIYGVVSD